MKEVSRTAAQPVREDNGDHKGSTGPDQGCEGKCEAPDTEGE